jgi:DNA polymerase sigma
MKHKSNLKGGKIMFFKGKIKHEEIEVDFRFKATAEELVVLTRNQVEINQQSLQALEQLWKAEFDSAKEEGKKFKRFGA